MQVFDDGREYFQPIFSERRVSVRRDGDLPELVRRDFCPFCSRFVREGWFVVEVPSTPLSTSIEEEAENECNKIESMIKSEALYLRLKLKFINLGHSGVAF